VILSSTFGLGESVKLKETYLPNWLKDFGRLRYLTLEGIKLNASFFEATGSVKHLILSGVSIEDKDVLVANVFKLKGLDYLVHDGFLDSEDITNIKKNAPGLIVLLAEEYDEKLESGQIKIPK
jgi:hypothetical protein